MMKDTTQFPFMLVRAISRAFVEEHYKGELASFDVVWDAFRRMVERRKGRVPDVSRLLNDMRTALGFAKPSEADAVGLIILGTVSKVIERSRERGRTVAELEPVVGKAAVESAASGELLAVLLRDLPRFIVAARSAKAGSIEGTISAVAEPQYEIWAQGRNKIVASLEEYEGRKGEYVIWIDHDEPRHRSTRNPEETLGEEAIALLLCLVERLGSRVPTEQVLKRVWAEEKKVGEGWEQQKNKMQQQLASLERFSGNQFREHLFRTDVEQGVGLLRSFADKYFMFRRWR